MMATVGTDGKPEQRTFIDGTVKYADEQGDLGDLGDGGDIDAGHDEPTVKYGGDYDDDSACHKTDFKLCQIVIGGKNLGNFIFVCILQFVSKSRPGLCICRRRKK